MIALQDVLISNDIVSEEFVCNLSACKGACCWKGDYGAPLNEDEMKNISTDLPKIRTLLSPLSQDLLDNIGVTTYFDEPAFTGTSLHPDGACVFMTKDELGIAQCSIEKAEKLGLTTAKKPISCHLYPIRVTKNEQTGFEAWNYSKWDICSEACAYGKQLKVPVYEFLKSAIIRLKGLAFYEELEAVAKYLNSKKTPSV